MFDKIGCLQTGPPQALGTEDRREQGIRKTNRLIERYLRIDGQK